MSSCACGVVPLTRITIITIITIFKTENKLRVCNLPLPSLPIKSLIKQSTKYKPLNKPQRCIEDVAMPEIRTINVKQML
jgi:hypothetical protein